MKLLGLEVENMNNIEDLKVSYFMFVLGLADH